MKEQAAFTEFQDYVILFPFSPCACMSAFSVPVSVPQKTMIFLTTFKAKDESMWTKVKRKKLTFTHFKITSLTSLIFHVFSITASVPAPQYSNISCSLQSKWSRLYTKFFCVKIFLRAFSIKYQLLDVSVSVSAPHNCNISALKGYEQINMCK